jgi:hypothetical protein
MKRRGFLGLLGLAPALPLIAKEVAEPAKTEPPASPESFDYDGENVPVGYEDALDGGSATWTSWSDHFSIVDFQSLPKNWKR